LLATGHMFGQGHAGIVARLNATNPAQILVY
jgi:hypothetical protein